MSTLQWSFIALKLWATQIINLYRLTMIAVMLCNINNVDDDMLNKWYLYTIKMMLKLRLLNIINCYNDDIIDKYI